MSNVDNARITDELLENVIGNICYNKTIIEYYKQYLNELPEGTKQTIRNRITNIEICNKFWQVDVYKKQLIKDFIRTSLCKDKFCNNCKKVKQAARMSKYMPELEKFKNHAYHMTLTQPNCSGSELKDMIKHMAKCYRMLNRYLSTVKKIKGLDFSSWGYIGSIRSLEVTYSGDNYHPHYHCFLVLEGLNIASNKNNINQYSYSYGKLKNQYSEAEILIQKIWYLLINEKKVTLEAIEDLNLGYSCKVDKLQEGDYNELFKYMTKEVDDKGNVLTYDNFRVLENSLYRVKQIQGYGCLFRVKDDFDVSLVESEYQKIIDELQKKENPVKVLEQPQDLLKDKYYTLISRKSYMKYLKKL